LHRYSPTIRETPIPNDAVKTLTTEEAVNQLRSEAKWAQLVHDTYLDADIEAAADRFALSGEFAAVMELVGSRLRDAEVVDLGAGNGMARRAFAQNGAGHVFAIEPDPSPEIGRGAIRRICADLPIESRHGFGEEIPLADASVDLVSARQVLHHTRDLNETLRECARILRPGGCFLACREHVVDNDEQLAQFLDEHPVHQLTGGESAYSLDQYTGAITSAGLRLEHILDPWDSPINTAPTANTTEEIAQIPMNLLRERFGVLGAVASHLPGVTRMVWSRLRRPRPGRLYSFLARKP
jgi:SAM-dependent methyltransferase